MPHVQADSQGELGGHHLPAGAHFPGSRDRRTQALQAPVGMDDRPLLLWIGLGREDDVGVLGEALREEGRVGDDGARVRQRPAPTAPLSQLAQGVAVQQVERAQPFALGGAGGDASPVKRGRGVGARAGARRELAEPRTHTREHPRLAQPAPVGEGRDFQQPGTVDAGHPECLGEP